MGRLGNCATGHSPAAAGAAAALVAITAMAVRAQTTRPKFEVASIKTAGTHQLAQMRFLPGRSTANAPLRVLMETAYRLKPFQIVGGPEWIGSEQYEVEAKATGDPEFALPYPLQRHGDRAVFDRPVAQRQHSERCRRRSHAAGHALPARSVLGAPFFGVSPSAYAPPWQRSSPHLRRTSVPEHCSCCSPSVGLPLTAFYSPTSDSTCWAGQPPRQGPPRREDRPS